MTSHIVTDHAFHTDVAPDNVLATSCMTVTQEVTDHHSLPQTYCTRPRHPKRRRTDGTDSSMEDNAGDECSGDNEPSDAETLRSQDSFSDID